VTLVDLLARHHPDVPTEAVRAGRVLVEGRVLSNPAAQVRTDAAVRVLPDRRLRGDIKLSHALDALQLPVTGCTALDLGASAGGFTTALLHRDARRVYAVDVGVGLLRTSLRHDPRVVDLGGTNLAELDGGRVPEPVELVTIDLSYLALAEAVPQLERLPVSPAADLLALVKPTFELHRPDLAATVEDLERAVEVVINAAAERWRPQAVVVAPRTGRRGALEAFLHLQRGGTGCLEPTNDEDA
jgi:23S rRNA (cytidine1920-2'-O)/16S rRNA (cytidine1409-2'-O)-methyltransferase